MVRLDFLLESLGHIIPHEQVHPKRKIALFKSFPKIADLPFCPFRANTTIISGYGLFLAVNLAREPYIQTRVLGRCFLSNARGTRHCSEEMSMGFSVKISSFLSDGKSGNYLTLWFCKRQNHVLATCKGGVDMR